MADPTEVPNREDFNRFHSEVQEALASDPRGAELQGQLGSIDRNGNGRLERAETQEHLSGMQTMMGGFGGLAEAQDGKPSERLRATGDDAANFHTMMGAIMPNGAEDLTAPQADRIAERANEAGDNAHDRAKAMALQALAQHPEAAAALRASMQQTDASDKSPKDGGVETKQTNLGI